MGFTWQSMLRVAGVRMVAIKLWGNHESLYCKSSTLQPSKSKWPQLADGSWPCQPVSLADAMSRSHGAIGKCQCDSDAWSMSFKDPR